MQAVMSPTLRHTISSLLALAFVAVMAPVARAEIATRLVASGLSSPVYLAAPQGDRRLFIVELGGTIKVLRRDGSGLGPTTFLSLVGLVGSGGERGLLGLAFAPDYATSGFLYVYYVNLAGNSVLARYRVSSNPNVADPVGKTVLTVTQPAGSNNHKGGTIAFGPDGYLYWGLGDGGGADDTANNAQNDGVLLGKMLRLDVSGAFDANYRIPSDNPFVGTARDPNGTILDEIWSKGLRNPFRFAFDRETGDLWIADVGQGQREEVDFEPPTDPGGRNYGWRVMEGTRCNVASPPPAPVCGSPAITLPVIEYDHGQGCSITGGTVYRGVMPWLAGRYFYADFCSNRIWTYDRSNAAIVERTAELANAAHPVGSIAAIAEDGLGELYLVDLGGEVFRIEPDLMGCRAENGALAPALLPAIAWIGFRRRRPDR